tara:strand:+ start:459 stop:635 length:177 start_codon:yes stop_codon:yes gene_type:complete
MKTSRLWNDICNIDDDKNNEESNNSGVDQSHRPFPSVVGAPKSPNAENVGAYSDEPKR